MWKVKCGNKDLVLARPQVFVGKFRVRVKKNDQLYLPKTEKKWRKKKQKGRKEEKKKGREKEKKVLFYMRKSKEIRFRPLRKR